MPEVETAYKYSIPLVESSGVESPAYSVQTDGNILSTSYPLGKKIVVVDTAVPHLHKDSVNVGVEEVNVSEYKEQEDGGEE